MERHAQPQIRNRTVNDAELEIDARALHGRRLRHSHRLHDIRKRIAVAIDRILAALVEVVTVAAAVVIPLPVIDALLLVDALYSEREAEIELVVQIGAHRDIELAGRSDAPHRSAAVHRGVIADLSGIPQLVGPVVIHQIGLVGSHGRPEEGVDPPVGGRPAVPLHGDRAVVVHIGAARLELHGEGVGDGGGPVAACELERIAVIVVGQPVVADAEIHAQQPPGPLVHVEDPADIAQGEAVLSVAPERHGPRGRQTRGRFGPRKGHHRRYGDFAAVIHAQAGRIDDHRSLVGPQRRERAAHGHRPRRAEIETLLRKREQIGSGQGVGAHRQSAELVLGGGLRRELPAEQEHGAGRQNRTFHNARVFV